MRKSHILASLLVLVAGAGVRIALAGESPREVIVKARIDGASELIITTNGLRWKNGMYAKPGRHEGRQDPTYVNGTPWMPKWEKPGEERGVDTSDLFPLKFATLDLDFELLAVGDSASATNIEVRSSPTLSTGSGSFIVNIPDPEWGSKWYVFALTERTPERGAKP